MVVNFSFKKWYTFLLKKQNTLFAIFSMLCYAIYELIK